MAECAKPILCNGRKKQKGCIIIFPLSPLFFLDIIINIEIVLI